jgi:hypothetical protein
MLDAIADILTDALVLLPLLVVVVVVIGLISWPVNLFCPRPRRGLSLFSSEGEKTHAGSALPTDEAPAPVRRRA